MRTSLDSTINHAGRRWTDTFVACLVRNLGYRWHDWRSGPEPYVDLDRRRHAWVGARLPRERAVTVASHSLVMRGDRTSGGQPSWSNPHEQLV